jgi:hypothetical protein
MDVNAEKRMEVEGYFEQGLERIARGKLDRSEPAGRKA